MGTRTRVSFVALFAAVMILPAMAEAQPWPEAHSGAYLGVQIAAVSPQQASALKLPDTNGALITMVDHDGPACRAGLLENDVVVGFDALKIASPQQLQGLIHATPPQTTVTLAIMRGGQRKEVKVTLGSWDIMSHARTFDASTLAVPPPPRAFMPDIEVPSFTLLSSRHGLVVESLSPQLCDFFGVPRGHGVLVRSVEGGSPAAAAGIKAGDIILRVNNETVHDMADWQRGMHMPATKISIGIWRDKHEQTVLMSVPAPGDSSQLRPEDWLDFDGQAQALHDQAQALRDQMEQMRPEIERSQTETLAQLGPSQKELEELRRQLEKSMKLRGQDIDKMAHDLADASKATQKEMEKLRQEIQRSMPSQKDLDELRRQLQQAIPSQQQLDDMKRQLQTSLPSRKDLEEMRRQIESSMKDWTPQWKEQMEQLKQQMEQQKLDLQQMLQDFNNRSQF